MEFNLEVMLIFFVGLIVIGVILAIQQQYTNNQFKRQLAEKARQEEEEARQELFKYPRKWSKAEIIIAAHIALYGDLSDEQFLNEVAEKLDRSTNALKRKIKRIIYMDTDNASQLCREVVSDLAKIGGLNSRGRFSEAVTNLTETNFWLKKYSTSW